MVDKRGVGWVGVDSRGVELVGVDDRGMLDGFHFGYFWRCLGMHYGNNQTNWQLGKKKYVNFLTIFRKENGLTKSFIVYS